MKKSTLIYLIRDGQWLMMYRNKKENDVNQGKWIGVGGKLEPSETFEACALRETREETGLDVLDLLRCGTLHFHCVGFEDEEIAVYRASQWKGTFHNSNEGELAWIPEEEILNLSLWEGDRIFLERMINGNASFFDLNLYYDEHGLLKRVEES